MALLIAVFILIFFALNFFLLYQLLKFFRTENSTLTDIRISIIIAAKNEEKNISQLIHSLQLIDYPAENFEVIIIDDESADKTFCTINELIKDNKNFSVYKAGNKLHAAKKGALAVGISKAKHPYVLITDADCKTCKDWLKSFAGKFASGSDFVFGPVVFYQNKNIVNKISSFERLRNSILMFSFAQAGLAYSASGASFGFSKTAFEKLNGYSATLKTFSGDDDLLLQQAVKHNFKIGTVNNTSAFVFTESPASFKKYFKQKTRHTKAALYYLPSRKFLLSIWHLINLTAIFSPLLILSSGYFILPFAAKLFFDLLLISIFEKKFNYSFNALEKIYLQIFYEFLLIINYLNALFKKDKWK